MQQTAHGIEAIDASDDFYNDGSDISDSGEESLSESFYAADHEGSLNQDARSQGQDSPRISPVNVKTLDTGAPTTEFPGPKEHAPTEAPSLSDGTAFTKALVDEILEAPLGQVYDMLFSDEHPFMNDFLTNNQKLLDVQITPFADKAGESTRSLTYIKPLSGPIGPKQTRCISEDTVEMKDFERAVQIVQSTTSPDVPSGDAFVIKTRFSLMWAERSRTRLVSNCTIEWSKSSWLKGAIEKASNNGQAQFMTDLVAALKSQLQDSGGKRRKNKTRKQRSDTRGTDASESRPNTASMESAGFVGTLTSIFSHVNSNVLIFVLLAGIMVAILRMQHNIKQELSVRSQMSLQHDQATWYREEHKLWEWLSDRTVQQSDENDKGGSSKIGTLERAQLKEAILQARESLAVLEEAAVLADADT